MDPNSDTVRSMSELLKMDESYQQELQEAAEQQQNNSNHSLGHGQRPAVLDLSQTVPGLSQDEHAPVSPCPSIRSQMSRTESTKRKREYKLKIFIGLLFLIIVGGVTVIFEFYKLKLYEVELGTKIKFDEVSRRLVIKNANRELLLYGQLGKDIPEYQLPYDCSNDKTRTKELCLLWRRHALMVIDYHSHGSVNCYHIRWSSKDKDMPLTDCFSLTMGYWYGGGLTQQQSWPLRDLNIPMQPFITGTMLNNHSFGPVIEPYWISSEGVALIAAPDQPLMVSFNESILGIGPGDHDICLSTHFSTYPDWELEESNLSWLNYTICTGIDVAHIQNFMSNTYFAKPTSLPAEADLKSTIWSTSSIPERSFSQDSVLDLCHKIVTLSFQPGILKIDGLWEKAFGDLMFDSHKFPESDAFLQNISKKGFTTLLETCPYISTKSLAFEESILNSYLVRDSGGIVPGLSQILSHDTLHGGNHGVGGVVEFHNETTSWLLKRIEQFKSGVTSINFYFAGGQAEKLPHRPYLDNSYHSSNVYTTTYAESALNLSEGLPLVMQSAYRSQHVAPLIQLEHDADERDSADTLSMLVQRALTLGILGYPLVLLPPVGGSRSADGDSFTAPSKEFYIRSLQLAAFFPFVQISLLPQQYDEETVAITQQMLQFHDNVIVPKIMKCLQEFADNFSPVIRPLWWIAPNDFTAQNISSQFLIGNDTLVVPARELGQHTLPVYLPEGSWKDGLLRNTFQGPGWFSYEITLNQTAYFLRLE